MNPSIPHPRQLSVQFLRRSFIRFHCDCFNFLSTGNLGDKWCHIFTYFTFFRFYFLLHLLLLTQQTSRWGVECALFFSFRTFFLHTAALVTLLNFADRGQETLACLMQWRFGLCVILMPSGAGRDLAASSVPLALAIILLNYLRSAYLEDRLPSVCTYLPLCV